VQSVYVPKDRVTNENNGFAFVEMKTERDAEYAAKVSGARGGGPGAPPPRRVPPGTCHPPAPPPPPRR